MSSIRTPQLRGKWDALSAKDQRAVLVAAVVVIAALIWLLGMEPAMKARERLERELPALQTQAAEVSSLAAEAKRLKAQAATATATSASAEAVKATLTRANLTANVSTGSDGRMTVTGKAQPAAQVLAWVSEVARELRLAPVSLQMKRTTSGLADFELLFEAAGGR